MSEEYILVKFNVKTFDRTAIRFQNAFEAQNESRDSFKRFAIKSSDDIPIALFSASLEHIYVGRTSITVRDYRGRRGIFWNVFDGNKRSVEFIALEELRFFARRVVSIEIAPIESCTEKIITIASALRDEKVSYCADFDHAIDIARMIYVSYLIGCGKRPRSLSGTGHMIKVKRRT